MRLLASTRPVVTWALACALTLVTACGGDDGNDPAPDAGPDVPSDAGPDVPSDGGPDVPSDGGPDVPSDGGPDVPSDGGPDVPSDGGPDVPPDGGPDVPPDGGPDVPSDGGPDVPSDAAPATPTLLVEPAEISVPEAGSATFTVSLSHEPSAPLDIDVSPREDGVVSVSPQRLVFDAGNFATPQTVTVTSVDDLDVLDESLRVTLSGTGVAAAEVAVSVDDDDTQAIVASTAGVSVGEVGTTTFTVRLAHDPAGPLEVALAGSDTSVMAVSPATLRFDASNFATPQTVTVSGVGDADVLDESVRVTLSGPGVAAVEVAVSVDDDDTQTIVASTAAVAVGEAGSATFTVRLSHNPSGPLEVAVASSDAGAASASPATLSFDANNFSQPQIVTVTGVADIDVRDESARVTLSGTGVAAVEVAVSVDDDDTQAIVASAAAVAVGEGGSTTFTVRLSNDPSGPLEIAVASSDAGAVAVSPATLRFDASNFATPQTVTVTGVADIDVRDESARVTLSGTGVAAIEVAASVADDDTQTIVASTAAVAMGEGGSATFTVRLSNDPSGPLEIAVASSDAGVATVSPATLRFDTSNFATPQTVTVTGVDDIDLLDESARVTLSGTGVAAVEVAASVADDDTQTIVASTGALTVNEDGAATFTVRLSHDPSGPVQVAVASSDPAVALVSPATLAFDAASFADPQTVTVTGVPDDDIEAGSVTVTLAGAGAAASVAVAVTVADTTQPPYPVDMFVRGSFNGFELDDALVFEGNASYSARISLHTDTHELKIADAAFSDERTFAISQDAALFIDLDQPTPLQRAAGELNNTLLATPEPGIYRFDLEARDLAAPVLTVSLDEPATYFRDMYVRGTFGGFEPLDRMTYEGSGRHTALVSLGQGVHELKISDELFSADATFSVSAAGDAAIELDTPTPLELADGPFNNTSLTISTPGVYLFDMDASDPLAPVLTITPVDVAPFAGNMYVRGGFNGFGLANELRYQGGGRYGGLVTLTQDTHAFKIADAAFSPGAAFSADATTPVEIGVAEPAILVPVAEQDSDTLVTAATLGVYRFELDAADPTAPVLTITLVQAAPVPADLYVRGSFNSFSVTDPLVFLGLLDYEARIELAAGTHEFKISDDSFSPGLTFSASATESVEIPTGTPVPFVVAPGVDINTRITIEQPGTYVFAVQVSSPTTLLVTVTPEALAASPGVSSQASGQAFGEAFGEAFGDVSTWLAAWLAALPGASPSR